ELVKLGVVLEDVQGNIQDLLVTKDVDILVDFSKADEINFSRKNLYSILYNLLSNAIKYSSPERRAEVKLTTELEDGFILLKVEDNGLGIKKDNLSKMFTLFKRFHSHVDGTGMG